VANTDTLLMYEVDCTVLYGTAVCLLLILCLLSLLYWSSL